MRFITLKEQSLKDHSLVGTFLQMPFHPCVSGCGHYLAPGDGHNRCLTCLGVKHAEAAFVDESCSHCWENDSCRVVDQAPFPAKVWGSSVSA